jgi:hypothetical protein
VSFDDGALTLRQLEERLMREIERRALANPDVDATESTRSAGGTPPAVTGIQKVTRPGTLTVSWSRVPITDLRNYEVLIATNATFTSGVVTRSTRELQFTWEEGDDTSTYYIKVRAINTANNPGAYSATVNTANGKVTTSNIDPNAASEIHAFTKTAGFTTLDTDTETETYGPVSIDVFDADSVVEPRVIFQVDFSSTWVAASTTNRLTIELLRRPEGGGDTVIDTAVTDFKSDLPGAATGGVVRLTLPTFTSFDQPGAGTFEYRMRLTLSIDALGSALSVVGIDLNMEFVQSKR